MLHLSLSLTWTFVSVDLNLLHLNLFDLYLKLCFIDLKFAFLESFFKLWWYCWRSVGCSFAATFSAHKIYVPIKVPDKIGKEYIYIYTESIHIIERAKLAVNLTRYNVFSPVTAYDICILIKLSIGLFDLICFFLLLVFP